MSTDDTDLLPIMHKSSPTQGTEVAACECSVVASSSIAHVLGEDKEAGAICSAHLQIPAHARIPQGTHRAQVQRGSLGHA